jgi:FAD/FMN-containing dehydrogenase
MSSVGYETGLEQLLRGRFGEKVILPDDPEYGQARRVWNGMIDRHPLAVLRASGVADIAAAVRLAREHNLPLAVRGGGHSVAGNGTVDRGLVLDLGGLRAIEVDPRSRTVQAEPGVMLGDLDRATEPHGLAVPVGVVSATGVAGLTVGGGIGWLTRAHGLTIDNLIAADVVVASGETIRASSTENTELFWGIRGGGGNFGVVSSFLLRAHPLGPKVLAGNLVYRQQRWPAALRAYEVWTRDLPDALSSIISFLVPPPGWEMGDDPLMVVGFAWASADDSEGRRVLAQLQSAAAPDMEVIEPTAWVSWQSAVDPLFPKGVRAYWKNTPFNHLDDAVIDTLIRQAGEQTWHGTGFDIHHMGGAAGRVPRHATPFPNRSARFWLNIYGFWPDPAHDRERIAFIRGLASDMEPFAAPGRYVNFLPEDDSGDPGNGDAYGTEITGRLMALKRRYDPDNLFRLNHNVAPR